LLTQALAPRLADGARVANLSSVLGSIASLTRFGTPSYDISKCAQNMVTALLAQALQPRGIVVLALHPGWAQTEMGGENATVPVADSVAGLLRVVVGASAEDSGGLRDWQGRALPWWAFLQACSTSSCTSRRSRPTPATPSACAPTAVRACTWCGRWGSRSRTRNCGAQGSTTTSTPACRCTTRWTRRSRRSRSATARRRG